MQYLTTRKHWRAAFSTLEAIVMLALLTIFSMLSIAVFKKGLPKTSDTYDEWKAKGGDAAVIRSRVGATNDPRANLMPPPQVGPKALSPTPGLDGEAVR